MLAPKEAVAPCSVRSMAFPSTSCAFQTETVSAAAKTLKALGYAGLTLMTDFSYRGGPHA
jgi:hypothetical protein